MFRKGWDWGMRLWRAMLFAWLRNNRVGRGRGGEGRVCLCDVYVVCT